MTEREWLEGTQPDQMVEYLLHKPTGSRKLALFACACCRQVWHLLVDQRSRNAVELFERSIEAGPLSPHERRAATRSARIAADRTSSAAISRDGHERDTSGYAYAEAAEAACEILSDYCNAAYITRQIEGQRRAQALLLHDIFGNPFRPAVMAPTLLHWKDGMIRRLAQAIYDERAFDRLRILADALEEAGCTDADILSHCRSEGLHVRGCWVIDLILGNT